MSIFSNTSRASSSRPVRVERVDVPERAHRERAFGAAQPVGRRFRVVPVHEAVGHELVLDRGERPEPDRVGRHEVVEPQRREHRRVEHVAAVVLHQPLDLVVPTLRHDLLVDLRRAPSSTSRAGRVACRSRRAMRMARSIATQHIIRPYTNGCRPPRVSQIPSSGWSQLSHTQSIMPTRSFQPALPDRRLLRARRARSRPSSRRRCRAGAVTDAPLPMRTGDEPM